MAQGLGLPGWLSGLRICLWCRRLGRCEFDPWIRKRSPRGGNGNPLQFSCLRSPMGRAAWWAAVRGITKSQTWLSTAHNKNGLSCPEARGSLSQSPTGDQTHVPCISKSSLNLWATRGNSTLVTIDEPPWTHQYHPKSIAYLRVHSWCCAFYEFGQMCNDMHSPLQHRVSYRIVSLSPKSFMLFCSSLPPPIPDNHWSCYCRPSFAFSGTSHSWTHTCIFTLASFT